jgi:hypothetical protein
MLHFHSFKPFCSRKKIIHEIVAEVAYCYPNLPFKKEIPSVNPPPKVINLSIKKKGHIQPVLLTPSYYYFLAIDF